MRKRKLPGFTLMEVLLVVAVMAVLVAVSIPTFTSYLEKSRESVCLANRRILLGAVYADYMSGYHGSLEESFNSIYQGADDANYVCPDAGTYYWVSDSETSGHIECTYHDGTGGPGGGDTTYPGTNIVIEDNYWPVDSDFVESWSTVTVEAAGIFRYTDGNYYIVSKSVVLTKSQAATGPGGDAYGWYCTQRITGRIVTFSSDSEQKSDLSRGDICQAGGDYYVFIDGGSWAYGPTSPNVSPTSWHKIP